MKYPLIVIILFLSFISLMGCRREENYRGVPEPLWKHLTAEQKQLIVDRAYEDDMKKAEMN